MKKLILLLPFLATLAFGQTAEQDLITRSRIDTFDELLGGSGIVADSNLDNTSDASKPVSTAQQAALDLKIDLSAIGTTVQGFHAYLEDIKSMTATQGDIMYFDGTDWIPLIPGTSGHYLETQGSGANPRWSAVTGSAFSSSDITGQTADGVPDDDDEFVYDDSGVLKKIDASELADYVLGKADSLNLSYSASETAGEPLDADDSYSGATLDGLNGGATIAQWEVVYFDGTAGEFLLADADGSGTRLAFGLATAATTDGNPISIIREGFVRNDAWAWTAGQRLYMGDTPGAITATAPSTSTDTVKEIGLAITDDVIFVDFGKLELTVE